MIFIEFDELKNLTYFSNKVLKQTLRKSDLTEIIKH